ncbi:MAG TPA: hypothetical protein VF173_15195 [Thermoanaerobaculia bacterium]|nr:hypothetical protein [Thermoanaerobaculia bacterium]
MDWDWKAIFEVLGVVALAGVVLSALLLAVAFRRLRRLRLPPDPDFFTTVRAVPLSLVVGLDLLDLALDSFSSPIIWFLLRRLNLESLRRVATVEAILPFTGPIPTLTLAWIAARMFNLGQPYDPDLLETERVGPGQYEARPPGR